MPEGEWQRLSCQWDAASRVDYSSPASPAFAQTPTETDKRYSTQFTMLTDGLSLFDISLDRWALAADLPLFLGETECTPSRLYLACTTHSLTLMLNRSTLTGVELNAFNLGFTKEPATVSLAHFTCQIAE